MSSPDGEDTRSKPQERGPQQEGTSPRLACKPGAHLPVLHPGVGPVLRRAFEERISRRADFKGRPNPFLCPHLTAPDPLPSLLKDPKHPGSLPSVVPRGEGGFGERPSCCRWGRSGTVWLWPFLDASISAVHYGLVSTPAALPMPSLTLFPVWRPVSALTSALTSARRQDERCGKVQVISSFMFSTLSLSVANMHNKVSHVHRFLSVQLSGLNEVPHLSPLTTGHSRALPHPRQKLGAITQ